LRCGRSGRSPDVVGPEEPHGLQHGENRDQLARQAVE
jgi:hypothetical protein